jgi:starch synthase (maltosyl-transferring)
MSKTVLPRDAEGPRIYNLFPLLAGPLPAWLPHIEHAHGMGFNWLFVNPFHLPGMSGSLYAVRDYYGFHPQLIDPAGGPPEAQLRRVIEFTHARDTKFMMDLVINHTAIDSPLLTAHPEWFQYDAQGRVVHPGAQEGDQRVTWGDLAAVDNGGSSDRDALWNYWLGLVRFYAALGVDGFRCDAAYQVPADLWRFLIGSARAQFPHLRFFAETLGCTPQQTVDVARAGFDYVFNSSKWWDFSAPWCLEQYGLISPVIPSISFPESHDTERLAAELNADRAMVRQRYVFAALFAAGVMIPVGFEYGFRKRLHVADTRPEDWEEPAWDDVEFIRQVNHLKAAHRVWNEEWPISIVDLGNPNVLGLLKSSAEVGERGLLILNKNPHSEEALDRELLRQLPWQAFLMPHYDGTNEAVLPPAGFRICLFPANGRLHRDN